MFDHFLTTVLQIIIVADVLGLIAYFVLGALKPQAREKNIPRPSSFWSRMPWGNSKAPLAATHNEFGKLKDILHGYQQGLSKA